MTLVVELLKNLKLKTANSVDKQFELVQHCLLMPVWSNIITQKAVPHVINSRALTGEKPCIKKAIHGPLMQGYVNFHYACTGTTELLPSRDVYCPALERA